MEKSARQQLISLIQQWNENRLDLFNLSFPDENDEFHGVMRFYFQEPGEKVVTKCVRVSSAATTAIVLEALISKFRPDLPPAVQLQQNILSKFSIWEVHENGDERKLDADEHPLIVQLTWHKDDREGRFLFKSNDKAIVGNTSSASADSSQTDELSRNSKRFSKRKKEKELRKKYQNQKQVIENEVMKRNEEEQISRRLYDEVPPTTFTRTISNPEAVMKKRREQKIENRLRQISKGGYVKIFSGELDPSRPYVTLLVGAEDRAYKIIRDTLIKLGGEFEKALTDEFCLIEITLPKSTNVSRSFTDLRQLDEDTTERFLHDDETPFFEFDGERINHIFAIRKRPSNLRSIKHQIHDTTSISSSQGTGGSMYQQIAADYAFDPILVPLDSSGRPITEKSIPLRHGATEIGSDSRVSSFIIRDPSIRPKHCIINFSDGLVSVTPLDGILEVNGLRAESTQQLRDGFVLRIGGEHAFRFHLSQRQNLPSTANYANSPIFQRPPSTSQIERPKILDLYNDKKMISSFPTNSSTTFDVMEETTFGVIDGQIMQRSKSTDALYQPLPLSSSSTLTTPTTKNTVFTPRTIDRMLQMRPPTHFPETTIQNLPAIIELYDHNVEDEFLHYLIFDKSYEIFSFRLTPAFMIYMVLRYRISPITYRQGISYDERKRFIITFLDKTIERCFHIIHINSSNKSLLSFWLSNCSELLHIITADKEISTIVGENVISKLKTTVEKCYDLLVETTRVGLQQPMSTFLKVDLNDEIASEGVIRQLDDLVQIIRKCHLNAALTIQLFSQLFYFISMYGFNWLVTTREGAFYLSRQFGLRLRNRLQYICHWAEKQGLELAAECHLDRLQQTVNLLTTPKTIDQIASLGATCYKLNSLQVKYLLENYVPEVGEPRASRDLIVEVVRLAESQADVMSKQDGFPIQLEESPQLHLSFVFPSDGYFVEDFKGIPPEMSDFIASLQTKGICRLIPQIGATGSWTIHMNKNNGYSVDHHSSTIGSSNESNSYQPYSNNNNNNNNISNGYPAPSSQASTIRASPPSQQIFLKRLPGDSIGLSIVAAQGIGDNHCGIYVKNVVPNSAAYRDGRLEKGDQLLTVNDQSLIGISQEEAAKRISSAGSDVRFVVSKRAAYFNGIIDSLEKSTTPNTPAAATVYQPIPTASTTNFPPQHQHQQQQYQLPPQQQQQQQSFINEPILHRHTRSASTSELFANQSDSVSLASMTNAHQYPNNNIQSSSRLPAHYKVSNRPAVVQPQRPYTGTQSPGPYRRAAAASPTPLYSQIVPSQQRSASTVPFNSSTMPKQNPTWLENYSNLPSIGEQPLSYSRMPSHISHGIATAGTTQYYSSNGSSPLPAAPPPNKDSIFSSSHQSHFPPASSAKPQSKPAPSGRLSAPLFEHSTRSFVEPTILSVEALDRELDAIESKGSMMTLVDKERYHELLKKISELRGPAPLGQSRSTSDFIGANGVLRPTKDKQLRNPPQNFGNGIEPQHRISKPDYTLPFMNEMASKLESKKQQQQQRPATLPKPDILPTTSTTSFSTLIQRPQISQTEKMIDDVSQQIDRINATPLTPSTPSTSTGPGGMPRPAMRDNSVSPEDRSKKRVQFSDTIEDVKENGHEDNVREGEEEYDEEEEDDKREPQNIVVGKHEVYNDPRQRRLNEIQQKSIKPAVDGAHLAFRDKMKMFAKQANETTPKDRQKTSSAQREIEQSTDSA